MTLDEFTASQDSFAQALHTLISDFSSANPGVQIGHIAINNLANGDASVEVYASATIDDAQITRQIRFPRKNGA